MKTPRTKSRHPIMHRFKMNHAFCPKCRGLFEGAINYDNCPRCNTPLKKLTEQEYKTRLDKIAKEFA